MLQSLVVGLGRAGKELHLPVLSRARTMAACKHLFADRPVVGYDPRGPEGKLPGVVFVRSLAEAAEATDPECTVVHLCTPPSARAEVLEPLARLGFRKFLVEKPLAVDEWGLAEMARLCQSWDLQLMVVAPWLKSTLTERIETIVRGGELGVLRSVSVAQRKPRFTRSLAGRDHFTAFDVEMPHSVGVAVTVAGRATVGDATWADMRFDDVVIPRLGRAWLSLRHDSEVRTEIYSDLTSPMRERRITLELDAGTLIGHYASSQADAAAQLCIRAGGRETRSVFPDDALTAFMVQAYEHFASPVQGGDNLALHTDITRLLLEAKRVCERQEPTRLLWAFCQRPPARGRAQWPREAAGDLADTSEAH